MGEGSLVPLPPGYHKGVSAQKARSRSGPQWPSQPHPGALGVPLSSNLPRSAATHHRSVT